MPAKKLVEAVDHRCARRGRTKDHLRGIQHFVRTAQVKVEVGVIEQRNGVNGHRIAHRPGGGAGGLGTQGRTKKSGQGTAN